MFKTTWCRPRLVETGGTKFVSVCWFPLFHWMTWFCIPCLFIILMILFFTPLYIEMLTPRFYVSWKFFYIFVCHPSIIEQDALKHKMLTKDKIKYMILNHKLCWFSYTVIAQCKLTRHWMWRPLLSVCTVLNIVNVSIYCYWLLS